MKHIFQLWQLGLTKDGSCDRVVYTRYKHKSSVIKFELILKSSSGLKVHNQSKKSFYTFSIPEHSATEMNGVFLCKSIPKKPFIW